ncbi:DUF2267 domain-containing protein [filamentous cyanobacterium CCP5]|nr:DUF2267 domain-containing protein [filamentous cyanobacterium CCP5]
MSTSHPDLLQEVQAIAQLESTAAAQNAIQASLEVLRNRIVGDEASQLADQLPEEMGQYLRGAEATRGESFGINEFYQRVAERGSIDIMQTPMQVKAVFLAISHKVSSGEIEDVKQNLPADYRELFLAIA